MAAACTPSVEQKAPPALITARFDVSATPPVVPTPNDLRRNGRQGWSDCPGAGASEADRECRLSADPRRLPASTSRRGSTASSTATVICDNVFVNDITNPAGA
jgi:hypothetical protein